MTNLEIEAFLAVCSYKSVSKAASELFVSQSSLSERLKTLEGKLGCVLFLRGRGNREITLTPEGEAFRRLALQHRSTVERMRAIGKQDEVITLRIGCLNSIGNYFLPSVYHRFVQQYPQSRLEIYTMNGVTSVKKIALREIDLGFSTYGVQADTVTATPLFSEPMAFICSADSDYPDVVEKEMLSSENEVYHRWCFDFEYWHQSFFGIDAVPKLRLALLDQYWLFTKKWPNSWSIVPDSVAQGIRNISDIRICRMAFHVPNRMIFSHMRYKEKQDDYSPLFLECFREILREQEFKGMLL